MKKLLLFSAVLAALSVLGGCKKAADTSADNTAAPDSVAVTDTITEKEAVITLKDDELFRPGVTPAEITVLDFNAVWCVPCKKLTPAYHMVAEQMPDVKFYSVDIDSLPLTKEAYGIAAVPTVVIIATDGTATTYTSLKDFTAEVETQGTTLTDTIAANLAKFIEQVKK